MQLFKKTHENPMHEPHAPRVNPFRRIGQAALLLDDMVWHGVHRTAEKIEEKWGVSKGRQANFTFLAGYANTLVFGFITNSIICTVGGAAGILAGLINGVRSADAVIKRNIHAIEVNGAISKDDLFYRILRKVTPVFVAPISVIAAIFDFPMDAVGSGISALFLTVNFYLLSTSNGMFDKAKQFVANLAEIIRGLAHQPQEARHR